MINCAQNLIYVAVKIREPVVPVYLNEDRHDKEKHFASVSEHFLSFPTKKFRLVRW